MINILHNSSFHQSMEPYNVINGIGDLDDHSALLMKEEMLKLDCTWDTYQDLIDKFITLHKAYAKELENSKKIKKSLAKCLKFYSRLCKKYETQQKTINKLEENIKQKINCLEESLKSQEKLKGLIEIYKSERSLYSKESNDDLRRDKEILLDICCKLIGESVKTNNIKSITHLILKKFKKDLDEEKLNLLKGKDGIEKIQMGKVKDLNFAFLEDVKPSFVEENFSGQKFNQSSDVDCEAKTKEEKNSNGDPEGLPLIQINEPKEFSEFTCCQSDVVIIENSESKLGENSNTHTRDMSDGQDENIKSTAIELNKHCEKIQSQDESQHEFLKDSDSVIDENRGSGLLSPKVSHCTTENETDIIINTISADENELLNDLLVEENDNTHHSTIEDISNDKLAEPNDLKSNSSDGTLADPAFQSLVDVADVNQGLFGDSNISVNKNQSCDKNYEEFQDDVINSKKPNTSSNSLFDVPEVAKEINNSYSSPSVFQYPCNESSNEGELEIPVENFSVVSEKYNCEERTHVGELSFNAVTDSDLLSDDQLSNIFNVMSTVKKVSPIKETKCTSRRGSVDYCSVRKPEDTGESVTTDTENNVKIQGKRNWQISNSFLETSDKNKKLKLNEEHETEKKDSCDLLDSIISAMSVQNEEFKSKAALPSRDESRVSFDEVLNVENNFTSRTLRSFSQRKEKLQQTVAKAKEEMPVKRISKIDKGGSIATEKIVLKEIKTFVSLPISTKEDAQMCVQRCVSVLAKESEDVVAKSMVAIVLENVNEDVKTFERPAPPLTETENRLIVLLSVFNSLNTNWEKITSIVMTKLLEKLFPDVAFWPDASVEAASRFYIALCRKQNDVQSVLKFFLKAMTEMKVRCYVAVFTALKTWPDVLQNASTLRKNILAVTIVNIFLHMPKTSATYKYGRVKKLLALKHLLMNFYGFTMDETIESHGKKVLKSFLNEETNSEKSLILLCTSREWNWIKRNIIPELKKILIEWSEGNLKATVGIKILSVMKNICSFFEKTDVQVNEIISYLSQVLNNGKLEHTTELCIIELLLQMKQFEEARKIISEWVPKCQISESLRNEIIEVSTENVLKILKPRRSMTERKKYGRFRNQGKGKKKKARNKKVKDRKKIKKKETTS